MNISEKQLMEAVKDLKSWCKQHRVLVGECECSFNDGGVCSITDAAMPCEIKVPCRWTEDDYKLAKTLEYGYVNSIVRPEADTCDLVKWEGYNSEDKEYSGYLPEGFFESLKPDERVHLCDIVYQYEECNNISNDYVDNKFSDNPNEKVTKDFERAEALHRNMLKRSIELCEEIDWNDLNQFKWYIFFDYYYDGCLNVGKICSTRDFSQIYFDTKEHAEQVLEEFKDELIWYFTEFKEE